MNISPPKFIKKLFPSLIWNFSENECENRAFLTFDDGPTPTVTEWVLDVLDKYGVKATFFCLAKNVEQYPTLFEKIKERGHAIGNHSYSHQNGMKIPTGRYIEDVDLADGYLKSNLYRPPYGILRPSQARRLSQRYKLIMWSVLSRDYSKFCTKEECLKNVLNNAKSGSIIVFHDSRKAFRNVNYALPRAIEELQKRGFILDKIEL